MALMGGLGVKRYLEQDSVKSGIRMFHDARRQEREQGENLGR
jgi:hypothetical protein